jgi:hypothetical protein
VLFEDSTSTTDARLRLVPNFEYCASDVNDNACEQPARGRYFLARRHAGSMAAGNSNHSVPGSGVVLPLC